MLNKKNNWKKCVIWKINDLFLNMCVYNLFKKEGKASLWPNQNSSTTHLCVAFERHNINKPAVVMFQEQLAIHIAKILIIQETEKSLVMEVKECMDAKMYGWVTSG